MAESVGEARQRHFFIDLYRTIVIIVMLEGHVVRALLSPSLQLSRWFQIHEFIHGLSAPAFLFGAGLTFVLSTRTRWEEYHHWGPSLSRRVRRLSFILLLGLMIHLPFFSIRKIVLEGTMATDLQLFQSDVLACIGLGLLSLHALVFFFKTERYFYSAVVVVIVLVCILTPFAWEIDFLKFAPVPVAQLMNGNHGSFFPLFPYVGFLFAGVIVSWEYLVAVRIHGQRLFMLKLAIFGTACIVGGIVFDAIPVHLYPHENFWVTSPNYFLIRVGILMLLAATVWYISRNVHRGTGFSTMIGRESLFVYVLHLLILYGSAMNPESNLQVMLGSNLNIGQSLLLFFLLTCVLFGVAAGWNYLKHRHFNLYRIVQLAASGGFLYCLFTRDF